MKMKLSLQATAYQNYSNMRMFIYKIEKDRQDGYSCNSIECKQFVSTYLFKYYEPSNILIGRWVVSFEFEVDDFEGNIIYHLVRKYQDKRKIFKELIEIIDDKEKLKEKFNEIGKRMLIEKARD